MNRTFRTRLALAALAAFLFGAMQSSATTHAAAKICHDMKCCRAHPDWKTSGGFDCWVYLRSPQPGGGTGSYPQLLAK